MDTPALLWTRFVWPSGVHIGEVLLYLARFTEIGG